MVFDLFARWLDAVKPLSRSEPLDRKVMAQKRKQRRLIAGTVAFAVVLGASWFFYNYIADAPKRARAQFDAGMLKMGASNWEDALRSFDRAIDIWPEFAEAYLNRGIVLHNLGRNEESLVNLDRASDLDPSLTRTYDERGRIYLEKGDVQKALLQFTKSIEIKPTADGFYQRGRTYESLGEHQKAIDDYNKAIAEIVDAPFVYRARALARTNLGDLEGAQADRDRAEQIDGSR